MANRPCANPIICPGTDNPLGNYSYEAPDPFSFLSFRYPITNPHNPIGGHDPHNPPVYFAADCGGLCVSFISQEDADLCAARQAFICSHTPPGGTPPRTFVNTLQTCSVNCGSGSVFVWQVLPGSFVALSQAAADDQAQAYACEQAARRAFCMSGLADQPCMDTPYSSTVLVTGDGSPPFTFALLSGSLPPGLSLLPDSPRSAVLAGTPTVPGTYIFALIARDSIGVFVTKNFILSVIDITNLGSEPDYTAGTPYNFTYTGAGGAAPYTFSIDSGNLPTGLTLSPDGTISGTPSGSDDVFFTVAIEDADGNICTFDTEIDAANCPGPNWSTMVWDIVMFAGGDSATGSASGASASMSLAGAADGSSSAVGQLHGSLQYNGPAVTCKMTISTYTPGGFGSVTVCFSILQNGVQVYQTFDLVPRNAQTINFMLADTGGVAQTIEFAGNCGFGNASLFLAGAAFVPFNPASTLQFAFTLANTC